MFEGCKKRKSEDGRVQGASNEVRDSGRRRIALISVGEFSLKYGVDCRRMAGLVQGTLDVCSTKTSIS